MIVPMDTSGTPGVGDAAPGSDSPPPSPGTTQPGTNGDAAFDLAQTGPAGASVENGSPAVEPLAVSAEAPPASDLVELRETPSEGATATENWWTPADREAGGALSPDEEALPGDQPPAAEPPHEMTYAGMQPFEVVEERKGRRFAVREVLETVVLALLIFVAVQGVVQNFRVEGTSMDPNLKNEERLLVNKGVYMRVDLDILSNFIPFIDFGDTPKRYVFHGPERGDIIVFEYPIEPDRDFIKRVIGLPGDWVEIRQGVVFVNGERIPEPYIKNRATYDYGPEQVPPDNYFVLGDNRPNSSDSHVWGFVPADNIIGKAWVTYWPMDDFGFAPNQDLSITSR